MLVAPRGMSAAPCGVSATPRGVSAAPRGMSAAPRGVPVAMHGVLALQDTHGNSRGAGGTLEGGGTIHEKFLWSRIA